MALVSLALYASGLCATKHSPGSEPADHAQAVSTRVLLRGGALAPLGLSGRGLASLQRL